ncbi:MAG TPA: hypothetical protein DGT23_29800 [Micromonosporaceae bacterium]|nr:hypothetical protein [Micromonosporaceae bacterium]
MQYSKQNTDVWPGSTVPVQLKVAALDGTYEGFTDLEAIETFAQAWPAEMPDLEMLRLLAYLDALGTPAERVATFGWTLRQGEDGTPEFVEAQNGVLEAETLQSYWDGSASRVWLLPRQVPVSIRQLPPLAQAYASHLRLSAYRFGPTDQPDDDDALIREAAIGAQSLGQLFAALLDDIVHACYRDRGDLGSVLLGAFASGMADILSGESSFVAQGSPATQATTRGLPTMIRHHQIKARFLRTGHLWYTGGSGNYVHIAAAKPIGQGKIDILSNVDQVDPGLNYTLDPEAEVSVSAMVPLPVWLLAQQWEAVISTLMDEAEELADIECASCDKTPPFCGDHEEDLRRARSKADIATEIRVHIGRQGSGAAPGENSTEAPVGQTYTAVGIWRDDEPVLVAVMPGDGNVSYGSLDNFDGFWFTRVDAANAEEAQAAAIADVIAHQNELLANSQV